MFKINRLDHLVLTVRDINATVDFYTKILNMEVLTLRYKNIEIKALRFGNQRINLHQFGKEIEPKAFKPTPGSADICFITETTISDVVNYLKAHNISIEKEPMIVTGTLGEMESVWFRDPDNNLIEISNYKLNQTI